MASWRSDACSCDLVNFTESLRPKTGTVAGRERWCWDLSQQQAFQMSAVFVCISGPLHGRGARQGLKSVASSSGVLWTDAHLRIAYAQCL